MTSTSGFYIYTCTGTHACTDKHKTILFLYFILYVFSFLLDIFFIYISNGIPFPGFPSENPLSPPVSSAHQHTLLFLVLGIPLHWGTEPSHPLLQMGAGVPCVLFGCWFSPWEPRGYRLIHIVVPPVRLETPLAPSVLSLTP